MFATVTLADGRLCHFEFGVELDPALDHEARIRRAMQDPDRLADEAWDPPPHIAGRFLVRLLDEVRHDPPAMLPIIRTLGAMLADYAAPTLEPLLEHGDAAVRLATIEALGGCGQHSSVKLLGPFAAGTDRPARRAATVALGKFGVPIAALGALGLAGDDAELKTLGLLAVARAWAFSKMDHGLMLNAVLETDEWLDLRGWFGFVVRELLTAARSPRFSDLARARANALLLFHRNTRRWTEALPFAQDDELDLGTRTQLALGFGRAKIAQALPWLARMLAHEDVRMHETAILTLGRIGHPAAQFPLVRRWDERDGALRGLLRVALRRLCAHEGAATLWDVVRNDRDAPAGPAVFVSDEGELSAELPRPWLTTALARRNAMSRQDAALLLGVYGGAAALPELEAARGREGNPDVINILDGVIARLRRRPDAPGFAPWPAPTVGIEALAAGVRPQG